VTRVVVDASVAVKWLIPEEFSAHARMLLSTDYQLLAPDLLSAELGNALWKKHRRRELDSRTATRLLRDFSRIPIELHPAGRLGNLALAAGNRSTLVTADRRLHDTCREGRLGLLVGWIGQMPEA